MRDKIKLLNKKIKHWERESLYYSRKYLKSNDESDKNMAEHCTNLAKEFKAMKESVKNVG